MPNNEEAKINLDNFIKTSDIRENIINWYDFEEKSNILFIGNDIYTSLFKNRNKVTVIEKDSNLFENIKHNKIVKKHNVNVLEYVQICKEKYDYVIIMDAMKRIGDFVGINSKKRESALNMFLKEISKVLTNDGVILFPVNNKFSIKNFSGATYENGSSYDVILGKEKNTAIFSKKEITNIIENSNFKYHKFYYPFPDHKLPSIVYSDEYLPNENNSKLSYLIYYNPEDIIVFNEMEAVREIVKEGKLDFFANSYFIEISNSKNKLSKVKFASFNNFRKKENKLITKMYDGYVQKEAIYEEGKNHIKKIDQNIKLLNNCNIKISDKVEEGKVYSEFQNFRTLNEILANLIINDELDVALNVIEKWYKLLNERFMCEFCEKSNIKHTIFEKYSIIIDTELKKKMKFLKNGLFDLIFENIFAELDKDNDFKEFIAYDQEWNEQYVPIEFILYRALNNLFYYNSKIKKYITIEELYSKFKIQEYVDAFKLLEEKIQASLIDNSISNLYETTYMALTTTEGLKSIIDAEEDKYNRLQEAVNKTNEDWQKAMDKTQKELTNVQNALKKYRSKDIIYKIKTKIKNKK